MEKINFIGFTGHRDISPEPAIIEKLQVLFNAHPQATWVVGGAIGFDTIVENFARKNGLKTIIYKPDYQAHGRGATFVRNRQIVDKSDLMVAFFDGRSTGGTGYTVKYAQKQGKQVLNFCGRSREGCLF